MQIGAADRIVAFGSLSKRAKSSGDEVQFWRDAVFCGR